jgi:hypothetical protein
MCEMLKLTDIHHLCIDTEGLDYLILNSIDLDRIKNKRNNFLKEWRL